MFCYTFILKDEIYKLLYLFLCILMQKAQRSYQKDKAKFEEARESLELDAQGCKYKICLFLLIEF